MRVLLVSDLHYDLRKLDWVLTQAADVDLLVVAGDLLDIVSGVPLDAQIVVVLEYLARFADRTTTVVCSGNHDLDHRTDGEREGHRLDPRRPRVGRGGRRRQRRRSAAGWSARARGGRVRRRWASWRPGSARAAEQRAGPWLWVYHGPPEGPLAWTGSRHYGDPELPRLLEQHRPDIVLCGHIHQAPFVDGRRAGPSSGAPPGCSTAATSADRCPAHVFLDLDERTAAWWSFEGAGEVSLGRSARRSLAGAQ